MMFKVLFIVTSMHTGAVSEKAYMIFFPSLEACQEKAELTMAKFRKMPSADMTQLIVCEYASDSI